MGIKQSIADAKIDFDDDRLTLPLRKKLKKEHRKQSRSNQERADIIHKLLREKERGWGAGAFFRRKPDSFSSKHKTPIHLTYTDRNGTVQDFGTKTYLEWKRDWFRHDVRGTTPLGRPKVKPVFACHAEQGRDGTDSIENYANIWVYPKRNYGAWLPEVVAEDGTIDNPGSGLFKKFRYVAIDVLEDADPEDELVFASDTRTSKGGRLKRLAGKVKRKARTYGGGMPLAVVLGLGPYFDHDVWVNKTGDILDEAPGQGEVRYVPNVRADVVIDPISDALSDAISAQVGYTTELSDEGEVLVRTRELRKKLKAKRKEIDRVLKEKEAQFSSDPRFPKQKGRRARDWYTEFNTESIQLESEEEPLQYETLKDMYIALDASLSPLKRRLYGKSEVHAAIEGVAAAVSTPIAVHSYNTMQFILNAYNVSTQAELAQLAGEAAASCPEGSPCYPVAERITTNLANYNAAHATFVPAAVTSAISLTLLAISTSRIIGSQLQKHESREGLKELWKRIETARSQREVLQVAGTYDPVKEHAYVNEIANLTPRGAVSIPAKREQFAFDYSAVNIGN